MRQPLFSVGPPGPDGYRDEPGTYWNLSSNFFPIAGNLARFLMYFLLFIPFMWFSIRMACFLELHSS